MWEPCGKGSQSHPSCPLGDFQRGLQQCKLYGSPERGVQDC